jgi:hypothetical protein
VTGVIYRVTFLSALSLWVAALFATAQDVTLHKPTDSVAIVHGYFLAKIGWLGPLEVCFAWYANLPFFYCEFKLACAQSPGLGWAWFATGLALSVFLPQTIFDFELGKVYAHYWRGPAVWLWFASFAVVLGTVYISRILQLRRPDQPGELLNERGVESRGGGRWHAPSLLKAARRLGIR